MTHKAIRCPNCHIDCKKKIKMMDAYMCRNCSCIFKEDGMIIKDGRGN